MAAEAYLESFDDVSTWAAEVLEGSMRTEIELRFDGRDFYGRDGRAMRPIFEDAIVDARRIALSRPELTFEVRRRHIEMQELREMVAMGRGELPNTIVVVSDFPPELMKESKDVGGYNAARKQTMLRILAMQPGGSLRMFTQTLDKSDRQGLEAVYRSLGFQPQSGELLGQRMHVQLNAEDQAYLVDRLTGIYDRTMAAQYGGTWYAGRENAERVNTYDFVRSQKDLIDEFVMVKLRDPAHAEAIRYDFAALMEKRFRNRYRLDAVRGLVQATFGRPSLYREMQTAGQEARSAGKTFSGCGATVRATGGATSSEGQAPSTEGDMQDTGYGNKEESKKLPATIRCINCKEKVPSKEVVKPKTWCCPKCKYEIDICTGKVLCSGNKK
jgi:hypothetical protein